MKLLLLVILVCSASLAFAQQGLHPYVGVHASGDSEMYYLGPSIQIGTDYWFNEHLALTGYLHSYRNKVDKESATQYEKGTFKCLTGAMLFEWHAGKMPRKGMFFGGGLAVQQLEDRFDSNWARWDTKRTTVLPAIRFGHAFPIGQTHCITAEINATGPYQTQDQYGSYTELITQLSIGTRFVW